MDRCCHVQWKGHLTDPPKKRKKEKRKTSCSTYWVVVQVDDDQSGVIQGAGKEGGRWLYSFSRIHRVKIFTKLIQPLTPMEPCK